MRRLSFLFGLFCSATLITSAQSTGRVGLANRTFHPTATRNWRGTEHKELRCILWYPAQSTAIETKQFIGPPGAPLFDAGSAAPDADFAPSLAKLPLIVLSHGSGGSAAQLAWLGNALARAGFIAVAVDHPGDNSRGPLTVEGFALWWERATDLSEVIDGVLADSEFGPRVDTSRIAAAGFSIGGHTVMELAGATTDLSVLTDKCRQHPDTAFCHLPEMHHFGNPDDVLQAVRRTSAESIARSADSFRDTRVRAVFAIAPAVGQTLTPDSLHAVRMPVYIVAGAADSVAPPRDNADWIRSNVRGAQETVLPGAAHYTFLDTCTAAGKSSGNAYCVDQPGADRDAIHAQVATLAVTFFNRDLRVGKEK